jgi:pimeloyl-ACP methyl ester carboxylesterase
VLISRIWQQYGSPALFIFTYQLWTISSVTMVVVSRNEWESEDRAGLVSIGPCSLFMSTGGPPRKLNPKAPVVIFITGGGAPTEWYLHLHRAISKFARNYFPDREGYGRSERRPHDSACEGRSVAITAEDSARDLQKLMQAIEVQPPYVLAAHSYGGIIARTYYDLYPDHVAGMALLDNNTELLQQCLGPIPPPAYASVVIGVDLEELTHLREASGMSDAEWDAAVAASQRTSQASADEATHQSGRDLGRRMQIDRKAMGSTPLIVMRSNMPRDWRKLFEAGMKLGGGTEDERREAERWVETAELYCAQVQKVLMELSTNAEYVEFDDIGHDFPIRSPERTAEVVERLLRMIKRK